MRGRALRRLAALLALLVASCARTPEPVSVEPAIVLRPPTASGPARAAPSLVPAAAALERDTAALRGQARSYVVQPDSKPEAISRLATLTLQVRRSLERVRANRSSRGYRATDIAAARAAADLLAAFLATRVSDGGTFAPVPDLAPAPATPPTPPAPPAESNPAAPVPSTPPPPPAE